MNRRQFDISVESDEKGEYWIVIQFPGHPPEQIGPFASFEEALDALDGVVADIKSRFFPESSQSLSL